MKGTCPHGRRRRPATVTMGLGVGAQEEAAETRRTRQVMSSYWGVAPANRSTDSKIRLRLAAASMVPNAATCVARRSSPYSAPDSSRAEEHTSELQSLRHLVCRLLLEKKTT